ncbi:peptidylprolyl isomerase [Yinghuangia aomiensis]|uniref:Peptidyl-prolyl cis-trans isomerase n=1 Tax=Yinghuangia aomiensis TaxID=676205 RepID=A0ABP9HS41_9ACTN
MVTKEQRQRALARAKLERQEKRRAEASARRRQRNQLIGAVVAVLVVAGGGTWIATALNDDDGKDSAKPAAADSPTPTPTVNNKPKTCAEPAPGDPTKQTWPNEPAMSIDTKAQYEMVLKSTCGDITVALDAAKAPHTVNSFNFLASQKYFDHTKCHRLTTEGMNVLQCGDPTGTGSGGPGYKLPDENLTGATYPAGTIAMANGGPNTGGSQFFLCINDTQLGPNYTPFGKVTVGMDVLKKILDGGIDQELMGPGDGTPHENVVFNSVTVTKKA